MALLRNAAAVVNSSCRPELLPPLARRYPQSSIAGRTDGHGRQRSTAGSGSAAEATTITGLQFGGRLGRLRDGGLRVSGEPDRGLQFGGRRGGPREDGTGRLVSTAAVLDPHSFAFLADVIDTSNFPVRIELDPSREIITERVVAQLSEEAVKTVYMVSALIFSWGCCVFGAMADPFYDSDEYRKAGGDGTGHWTYARQEREESAAREEMWSEDLLKEIEEKAEEVRKAEDEEKEKEIELV